jgi:hypothetical protein
MYSFNWYVVMIESSLSPICRMQVVVSDANHMPFRKSKSATNLCTVE